MDRSSKVKRLSEMLSQIAPQGRLEELSKPKPVGGAPFQGFAEFAELPEPNIDNGLQKLKEGRHDAVTPPEVAALEAIVLPTNRPVAFIRNGTYDNLEAPWTGLNAAAVRARLTPKLRCIGRVEAPSLPAYPFLGTAFVVGPNLLITNRHVARLFSEGLGTSNLRYSNGDAAVDFKREVNTPDDDRTAYFVIRDVIMIHPYWDMALLRVEGLDAYAPLSLDVRPPEELIDADVVTVGYPARDDRNDLALQDKVFGGQYNVKRFQPGKLRPRGHVISFGNDVNASIHNCSTLGGDSGAAVLDIQTGKVVGLHFGGEYLKANYAVPTYELARDRRVVAAKLNFDGTHASTNEWDTAWANTETSQKVVEPPVRNLNTPPVNVVRNGANATWTLPLSLSVSVGQPAGPMGGPGFGLAVAPALELPRMQVPVIYGGLEHRKGYDPGFLGLEEGNVPLPTITALGKQVTAKLEDGSDELKYHKFSIVVHRGRRMALFTASNVDWRPDSRMVNGSKPTRKQLTGLADGQLEQWMTDWRIPDTDQLPDIFYTKDGGAFDKGHLVRREDVCWGKTFKDIQKGNGDTYHTTNCSPQVAGFNQSSKGEDNWGDLEDLVQKETKAEKAIIFSGPAFEDGDPIFEGRDDTGSVLVRIPRRFWKIILVKGDSGPEAYGFVLEQDLSNVPLREEFAVPANWRVYMRSLDELEGLLQGLAEFTWVKQFDKFNTNEGVRLAATIR